MISEYESEIYVDSLSKIRNRRYLDDKLIFKPCRAVVMADIDLFKNVNDTAGHQGGDEAIQKVAKLLEQSVRKDDVVIRYGGDEYMVVFFDISREDLEVKLSHFKEGLKSVKIDNSPEVRITLSFGAAFGTELVKNLIAFADKALYESKKIRDTYTIYDV
jgi:diguanylate cyclase (GGDEF)-like protein